MPDTNDRSSVRISRSVESMSEASPWALETLIALVYFVVFSNVPSVTLLMTEAFSAAEVKTGCLTMLYQSQTTTQNNS